MNIKILDCTLRDGGYINNWKFSNKQISNIIDSLEKGGLDIIECGYLNSKKGQESNTTLYDTIENSDELSKNLNVDKVLI